MRVTVDQQLERRISRQLAFRDGAQAAPFVARRIAAARLRAAQREARREIRMQHAVRANRQRVAQHPTEHAVAAIFHGPQPVTMLDPRAPSAQDVRQRTELKVQTRFAQHVAAPAVVIASDHRHRHTGIAQIHQRGEDAHAAARNDALPLEPEFEEIPVDEQGSGAARQRPQKRQHRSLDRLGRMAEVDIRDHIAGWLQHGWDSTRAPRALQTRGRRFNFARG